MAAATCEVARRRSRQAIVPRDVLTRYVPEKLSQRLKTGFGVPYIGGFVVPCVIGQRTLLNEQRLEREGYLKAMPIRNVWQCLLAGRSEWEYGGEPALERSDVPGVAGTRAPRC